MITVVMNSTVSSKLLRFPLRDVGGAVQSSQRLVGVIELTKTDQYDDVMCRIDDAQAGRRADGLGRDGLQANWWP
jgi:hypothetical protein